jgi:glycosyltransferase involved in cell wall biosynthesis
LTRTATIITACKGRLEHLKQSLPQMLAQGADEVIVVDYSCPEGAGEFVRANFPSVRVVSVPGERHFSNWKARNAGAAVATSDLLVFVDADTILVDGAVEALSNGVPNGAYGFFDVKTSRTFNADGPRVASNQLKGFHVIPAAAFRKVGGYDEVFEGYAAGADTDLEQRLGAMRLGRHALDPAIIASVIQHDILSRLKHHAEPIAVSYCAGLLYRAAKAVVLRMRGEFELPLQARQTLFEAARTAARTLKANDGRVGMNVVLGQEPVRMPRQLGYERGTQTVSLRVEVSLEGELDGVIE